MVSLMGWTTDDECCQHVATVALCWQHRMDDGHTVYHWDVSSCKTSEWQLTADDYRTHRMTGQRDITDKQKIRRRCTYKQHVRTQYSLQPRCVWTSVQQPMLQYRLVDIARRLLSLLQSTSQDSASCHWTFLQYTDKTHSTQIAKCIEYSHSHTTSVSLDHTFC